LFWINDNIQYQDMPVHPHNILVLDNNKIELFNLVDADHDDPVKLNFIKQYDAPEWNSNKMQSNSSMIYSLGCVLHQMSTLRNDFGKAKPPFTCYNPDLLEFIIRMMSK